MATILMDRDGKSKTASAVDAKHYPEQNEVPAHHPLVPEHPDHEEIARRAYELWCERGCLHGNPQEDWYRAERELLADVGSPRAADKRHASSGSVQR
ncbi:MAG TPA: DUF2934 domain-containing protein [Bryobacteraceae bacterium]|nr:DUF2934 domain-containing protein [Bryobacteraceae bacterium]